MFSDTKFCIICNITSLSPSFQQCKTNRIELEQVFPLLTINTLDLTNERTNGWFLLFTWNSLDKKDFDNEEMMISRKKNSNRMDLRNERVFTATTTTTTQLGQNCIAFSSAMIRLEDHVMANGMAIKYKAYISVL